MEWSDALEGGYDVGASEIQLDQVRAGQHNLGCLGGRDVDCLQQQEYGVRLNEGDITCLWRLQITIEEGLQSPA